MNSLIVQKYGGSSLANAERIKSAARRIARSREDGNQVVAVVSAMGDTTDDLIQQAHTVTDSPDPRELALLLSTGEIVSCTLVTMALRALGYSAIGLSGGQAGIQTDTDYTRARIVDIDPSRILAELREDRIVVVAGFQGATEDSEVTTLGRGASDTTAVALAAALEARVDGIFTADPRVVPDARVLESLTYEEMLELASYGAKMHPRSIELGAMYNIPILVTSSFKDVPGTLIH